MIALTANKADLESESRANLVLQLDPAIRYAAIIDYSNKTIECKGQGACALSLENFREFVAVGPLLALGSMGAKLQPSCGQLTYLVGRFENTIIGIFQLPKLMVVLAVDSTFPVERFEEFTGFLKQMNHNNSYYFSYIT